MNINNFIKRITDKKLSVDRVCFNNHIKDDVFCVIENYHRIEVYYRERGIPFDFKVFYSEDDAIEYLIHLMEDEIV